MRSLRDLPGGALGEDEVDDLLERAMAAHAAIRAGADPVLSLSYVIWPTTGVESAQRAGRAKTFHERSLELLADLAVREGAAREVRVDARR